MVSRPSSAPGGYRVRVVRRFWARRSGIANYYCRVGDTFLAKEWAMAGIWVELPDSETTGKWGWLPYDAVERSEETGVVVRC